MIDNITKFLIEYPSKELDGPYFGGPYVEQELRELATKLWEQVLQPEMKKDYVLLNVRGGKWEIDHKSLEALIESFMALKGKLKVKT